MSGDSVLEDLEDDFPKLEVSKSPQPEPDPEIKKRRAPETLLSMFNNSRISLRLKLSEYEILQSSPRYSLATPATHLQANNRGNDPGFRMHLLPPKIIEGINYLISQSEPSYNPQNLILKNFQGIFNVNSLSKPKECLDGFFIDFWTTPTIDTKSKKAIRELEDMLSEGQKVDSKIVNLFSRLDTPIGTAYYNGLSLSDSEEAIKLILLYNDPTFFFSELEPESKPLLITKDTPRVDYIKSDDLRTAFFSFIPGRGFPFALKQKTPIYYSIGRNFKE